MATEHKKRHAKDLGPFQPKAWTTDLVPLRELNSKVTHMTKPQETAKALEAESPPRELGRLFVQPALAGLVQLH